MPNKLKAKDNHTLNNDESINCKVHGDKYKAVMQGDGNFVLYHDE